MSAAERRIDDPACRWYSPRVWTGFLAAVLCVGAVSAETFEVDFPVVGRIEVEVSHAAPEGGLVAPSAPEAPPFAPPSIFSAPLPSGSGARALGVAGAFTAVADDATAASWNPAGLIQLERPEASAVLRYTRESDQHWSDEPDFQVGRNDFDNTSLNYFSLVWPVRLLKRNWVVSANFQEAYDFTKKFTADLSQRTTRTTTDQETETHSQKTTDGRIDDTAFPQVFEYDVVTEATTRTKSTLRQTTTSEMLTDMDFQQGGIIDAFSPAMAVEVTPWTSVGTAINFYHDNPARGRRVMSRTVASYSGTSESSTKITTESTTESSAYVENILWSWPPFFTDRPLPPSDEVDLPSFTDTTETRRRDVMVFDGVYEETNEYRDFRGMNRTVGLLTTVSRYLVLGFTVDFPWTATAEQTKTVKNKITTYDQSRTKVLDVTESEVVETKNIELNFPLYWAVGALCRWNNRFHTSVDVSQTTWSDFAFRAEGEEWLNPLDGSPLGESEVRDCWSVSCGSEFLWVLPATEIPFRGGASWQQRPAVGKPDEFCSVSLGTGVSIGKDPGKLIIDFAYIGTWGRDVMKTFVPTQPGLSTDVTIHQGYVSGIWHF